MSTQFVEALLTAYARVNLAAWDNLRIILSECALHGHEARGLEVEFASGSGQQPHYWVQIGHIWLDCGRTNAYSAAMTILTDEDVIRANTQKTLECAMLSQEQIGLLCMQNAHFDHCI